MRSVFKFTRISQTKTNVKVVRKAWAYSNSLEIVKESWLHYLISLLSYWKKWASCVGSSNSMSSITGNCCTRKDYFYQCSTKVPVSGRKGTHTQYVWRDHSNFRGCQGMLGVYHDLGNPAPNEKLYTT
jgi:hypothetical protein